MLSKHLLSFSLEDVRCWRWLNALKINFADTARRLGDRGSIPIARACLRLSMLRAALTGAGTAAGLTCAAAAALPATEHTPSGLTVLRLLPAGVAGAVPRHAKTKLAHAAASWVSGGSPQRQSTPFRLSQSAAWAALAGPTPGVFFVTGAPCHGGESAADAEPGGERALRCGRGLPLRHLPL